MIEKSPSQISTSFQTFIQKTDIQNATTEPGLYAFVSELVFTTTDVFIIF